MRASGLVVVLVCAHTWLSSPRVHADHGIGRERIDFTAYTLQRNEFSVGVGAAAYGVMEEITVGTYVAPWFAFPLVGAPISSGFLKLRDWLHGPLSAALRAAFVYLPASALSSQLSGDTSTRMGFLVVPLELSLSLRVHSRVSQSLQLTWAHVAVDGSRPRDRPQDLRLGGASAVTSLSLSSLSEFRLSHVIALTLRGNLLLNSGDLVVRGKLERNGTHVNARLGATELYDGIVANVIPGVALSWSNVNLHLGLGIGSNWLPYVGLPIRMITVVPDVDFYVRF